MSHRYFHSCLTIGSLALLLSACSPQYMPKGYTYQDDTPLSSPAPSSPWNKSVVIDNTENIGAQTAAWQGAVYELLDKLEVTLPKDGTPLNLTSESNSLLTGGRDASLDHYLRQALLQKGYNLTTIPDAGLQVTYKTEKSKMPKMIDLVAKILDGEGKVSSVAMVTAAFPQ
jgi:hypothetical protein